MTANAAAAVDAAVDAAVVAAAVVVDSGDCSFLDSPLETRR